MKNRKFTIPFFSVYDCKGFENYLEKQAEKGWMLEKATSLGMYFKKTEPKKVHFSVNFLPEGSMFESEKSEKYEYFKELSQHNGWELICVSSPHMFFCSEQENPIPIETDPVLSVETVNSVVKKGQLPLLIFGAVITFVNFLLCMYLLTLSSFAYDGIFSILSRILSCVSSAVSDIFFLAEIVRYKKWYKTALKLAKEENLFLNSNGKISYTLWAAFFAISAMSFSIISINANAFPNIFIAVAAVFVATAIIIGANCLMRKLNVPTKTNKTITLTIGAVICVAAFCIGFLFGFLSVG